MLSNKLFHFLIKRQTRTHTHAHTHIRKEGAHISVLHTPFKTRHGAPVYDVSKISISQFKQLQEL